MMENGAQMKILHFLLTLLQLVPAFLSQDTQRLAYLLYLLRLDPTSYDRGSNHHNGSLPSPTKHIDIDADVLYDEYFIS